MSKHDTPYQLCAGGREVKELLGRVSFRRGIPFARSILHAAGLTHIREMQPSHLAGLTAACHAALVAEPWEY